MDACPLCFKVFKNISQHLRVTHHVVNLKERSLLLKLVSGRVDIRKGKCCIPGCGQTTSRLDRHLESHTELSSTRKALFLQELKRKSVLLSLAELRASNPSVALVSDLDIREEEEEEQRALGPAVEDAPCPMEDEEEVAECLNCVSRKQHIKKLTEELSDTTKELQLLRHQIKAMRRSIKKRELAAKHPKTRASVTAQKPCEKPAEQEAEVDLQAEEAQPAATENFPEHVPQLNELLEDYQHHQEGPDPSYRLKNNVKSKIYRIKRFIAFMAVGQSHLHEFTFLDNAPRIREWVRSLMIEKVVASTLAHYVKNVAQFLGYLKDTPPPTCRLKRVSLINITREIKGIIKKQRRSVVIHEIKVKESKDGRAISKETLLQCRLKARQQIPEILKSLEGRRSIKLQRSFYGHLTAYLSCIYGHRTGVYQNLQVEEVLQAKHHPEMDVYLINVESHKTNETFGVAQLLLTAEEYGWFRSYIKLRNGLPGGKISKFFFSNSTPNTCKNLNEYLQHAWQQMKLPGKPKFTDIRSSIATHARNELDPKEREMVAHFMCHNTSTANKFYALNLTTIEAAKHRDIFESLVQPGKQCPEAPEVPEPPTKKHKSKHRHLQPSKTPGLVHDSSEEDKEVPVQESGSSVEEDIETEEEQEDTEEEQEDTEEEQEDTDEEKEETEEEQEMGEKQQEEEQETGEKQQKEEHRRKSMISKKRSPRLILSRLSPLKLRGSPRRISLIHMAQQRGRNEKRQKAIKRLFKK
ncbi:uncharacterized protein LOC143505579 isoform X2 [Brachyhypopomus gauderio]